MSEGSSPVVVLPHPLDLLLRGCGGTWGGSLELQQALLLFLLLLSALGLLFFLLAAEDT